MAEYVDATAFIVVKAQRGAYRINGKRPVYSAKITQSRQSRPPKLGAEEVAVKVTVRLPKAAFDPLEPEALVVVPEELVQHVVEVEAQE
jgi:hypothetical protein